MQQKPWPMTFRRGRNGVMQAMGLRPDWEHDCTSRRCGRLPASVSSSPQITSHQASASDTVLGPLRWKEKFCMVSGFWVNRPVRCGAQVWQGAPPSPCVLRRLGKQLFCLDVSEPELERCTFLQVRHQEAPREYQKCHHV